MEPEKAAGIIEPPSRAWSVAIERLLLVPPRTLTGKAVQYHKVHVTTHPRACASLQDATRDCVLGRKIQQWKLWGVFNEFLGFEPDRQLMCRARHRKILNSEQGIAHAISSKSILPLEC